MKEFKEGDKVICDGVEGVVSCIYDQQYKYPVIVDFVNGHECFTLEGKSLISHDYQSLFHVDDNDSEEEIGAKEFKAGDRVIREGVEGVVAFVNRNARIYPVNVEFDNGVVDVFTIEGKAFTSDDYPSLFHADQTSFQTDVSIVDILNREGYGTLTDGDKIYVGREGVVVATLIMRGKG